MSLSTRLLLGWFVIAGLATVLFLNSILNQVPSSVRQASEEVMVESANLLAEIAEQHWQQGFALDSAFATAINRYLARQLDAQIWSRHKTGTELVIYLTDLNGTVLYHTDPSQIGADYSRWRDVSLTLRGEGSGSFRISYSLEAAPSGPVRATSGTATTDLTTGLTLAAGKGWREMLLTPACLADAGDSLTIRTEAPLTFSLASVERVSLPEGTACSF